MQLGAPLLVAAAGGAICGSVAGFLFSLFVWWEKDFRDARLRASGSPLPSDRVFPRYHRPVAIMGMVHGVLLTSAFDVPVLHAALSLLVLPALYLPVLAISGAFTWLQRRRR